MEKLTVSANPHIKSAATTQRIMLDVIIALVPAGCASVVIFGWRSLLVIATCVLSAVIAEFVSRKIMRRSVTITDLSAVVTGLLLAYNLPVTIPLWMAAIGSAVAIVVVKQLFGGIGHNFVNPALIGRIVLMNSFTAQMSHWVVPAGFNTTLDAVTGATPLAVLSSGGKVDYMDLLLGTTGGCLGETCVIALLLGGAYLVIRRVISPIIPLVYITTVAVLSVAAGQDALSQIMSGGLMIGAIFMATDYATSPCTFLGKIIYAVGCGAITAFIRFFGSIPEGVSYSIIIMNIITPHIDRLTRRKPFGAVNEKSNGEAAK